LRVQTEFVELLNADFEHKTIEIVGLDEKVTQTVRADYPDTAINVFRKS
jgi:hypothetical protein